MNGSLLLCLRIIDPVLLLTVLLTLLHFLHTMMAIMRPTETASNMMPMGTKPEQVKALPSSQITSSSPPIRPPEAAMPAEMLMIFHFIVPGSFGLN